MAYTKYSLTPANNNATPPDGAPEGMLPSAVNDTMRDMMSQIRDCGDGIRDGTYTMTAPKITGGTITGATFTGNTFSNPIITGVATFSAGTVSAPAITTSGDTNTGIFFPAADTIAFAEGGVESMRIDSSGNVGIGTSTTTDGGVTITTNQTRDGSVNAKLALQSTGSNNYPFLLFSGCSSTSRYGGIIQTTSTSGNTSTNSAASIQFPMDSATACHMSFWTNANIGTSNLAERMRITSGGDVGIGTSSPQHRLDVQAASSVARFQSTTGTQPAYIYVTNTGGDFYFGRNNSTGSSFGGDGYSANIYSAGAYPMVFFTNGTEQMRIDSNGSLLVGSTASNVESGVGFKFVKSGTTPYMGIVVDGNVSNYHYYNVNAVNNGYRFYINANGGISNYSGNNVNLSDERTKTNIELASFYLDKICAIPVKTFNYKDEPTGEQTSLGVIAQDVEKVAPELVDTDGWKDPAPEGEEPLKSIYTTDLMFALMKSIQELNAKVEAQAAEIALLKSK